MPGPGAPHGAAACGDPNDHQDAATRTAVAQRLDRIDALMLALVTIWGAAFPGLRALKGHLDPFEMTWYRYAAFPVAYGVWIGLRRRDRLAMVDGGDWVRFLLLGTLAVVGYHFPLNIALHGAGGEGISAATGAIVVATVPVWTLLIAVLAGKERLRMAALAGSALAFLGVAVVVVMGVPGAELRAAKLALLAMLAPMSWAIYGVWAKPLIAKYGGLFVTGITMSLGTLVILPLGIDYGVAPLASFGAVEWFWLAWLAVLSTVAGYAMYNHALKHRDASDVAVYIYLNPVVATSVGWLALGEAVTMWFFVGGALVIAGVVQVNRARQPSPRATGTVAVEGKA